MRFAAGHVAGGSGRGTFAGSVREGPLSGWLADRTFDDATSAEIHLVINDHDTYDHDGDPDTPGRYTPMSSSAQMLRDPATHSAGATYPHFDPDASRRANVAAWQALQELGAPCANITRIRRTSISPAPPWRRTSSVAARVCTWRPAYSGTRLRLAPRLRGRGA